MLLRTKYLRSEFCVHAFVAGAVCAASCQMKADEQWERQAPSRNHPNRFGLMGRAAFNVSAQFSGFGNFPAQSNPGPPTGAQEERFYDDGYVRVDISGNAGGQTWFWGYDNASQVMGNQIVMHSASGALGGSATSSAGASYGAELTYSRYLGDAGRGSWGLESGLGYSPFSFSGNETINGDVTLIRDSFSFAGLPPGPGHRGTFEGPGFMINSEPVRDPNMAAAGTISAKQMFDADLFAVRVGPYFEFPLHRRVSVFLSGGPALAIVDAEFRNSQTLTTVEAGSVSRSGRSAKGSALWGLYAGGHLSFAVTERVGLLAGIQYHYFSDFTLTDGGSKVELDFSKGVFAGVGIGYSF